MKGLLKKICDLEDQKEELERKVLKSFREAFRSFFGKYAQDEDFESGSYYQSPFDWAGVSAVNPDNQNEALEFSVNLPDCADWDRNDVENLVTLVYKDRAAKKAIEVSCGEYLDEPEKMAEALRRAVKDDSLAEDAAMRIFAEQGEKFEEACADYLNGSKKAAETISEMCGGDRNTLENLFRLAAVYKLMYRFGSAENERDWRVFHLADPEKAAEKLGGFLRGATGANVSPGDFSVHHDSGNISWHRGERDGIEGYLLRRQCVDAINPVQVLAEAGRMKGDAVKQRGARLK